MAEEEIKSNGTQFEGKEEYVKDVFTEIASYYDEMNDIMSLKMIKGWHQYMMKLAGDLTGKRCADIGTGTGEIAYYLAEKVGPEGEVVGIDITPEMLKYAEMKQAEKNLPKPVKFEVGDALDLQYPECSFYVVTSGYMLRNVTDILGAVSEMHRVLAPGGKVIVAELSKPKNKVMLFGYNMYMKRVKRYGRKRDMGKSINGRQSAYEWLTSSIEGFPYGEDMVKIFRKAGFEDARFYVKSFGAVNIYVATK